MTLAEKYAHRHDDDAPRYTRLETVLYCLMRDHLPAGVLAELVEQHAALDGYTLSNPGLAQAACDLAEVLR